MPNDIAIDPAIHAAAIKDFDKKIFQTLMPAMSALTESAKAVGQSFEKIGTAISRGFAGIDLASADSNSVGVVVGGGGGGVVALEDISAGDYGSVSFSPIPFESFSIPYETRPLKKSEPRYEAAEIDRNARRIVLDE